MRKGGKLQCGHDIDLEIDTDNDNDVDVGRYRHLSKVIST